MTTVLLVIDNSKRELFANLLLKQYLSSFGIRSVICSRFAFRHYYVRYSPDAVVWPNALGGLSDIPDSSVIFVMPSESGNGQPDLIRATHAGTTENPIYSANVDRFFCWGPAMREILLESGKWRPDQLIVSGHPSTDHWLLPSLGGTGLTRKVGLTTTFRALSNYTPLSKMNYFEWLDAAEISGGDGTYFKPPEHAESWIFFEASLARVMCGLLRAVAVEGKKRIEIRPHPAELKSRYRYLRSLSPGRVSVTKDGTVSEWLGNISVLFTYVSASALDAVIRGVPVVSLRGMLDADSLRKIPSHFRYNYDDVFWQLTDFRQAVEYIELAERGKLEPCKDEKKLASFLKAHCLYPRSQPAARQIAIEIKEAMESGVFRQSSRKSIPVRNRDKILDWMSRTVPGLPQFLAFGRYLYGLLPGELYIGSSYQPWKVFERRRTMRSVTLVQERTSQQEGKFVRETLSV